jgi:hypothetical protein
MIRIRFNGYDLSTFLSWKGTPGNSPQRLPIQRNEVKREGGKSGGGKFLFLVLPQLGVLLRYALVFGR